MSAATPVSSVVTSRYARAFIDLAAENKAIDKVEKDLSELSAMIESSADLKNLIRSPASNGEGTLNAVLSLADKAKFQKLTRNFLGTLVQNGRLNALEAIIKAAQKLLSERRGEISAKVQTASALNAAQTKALQESISKAIGAKVMLEAVTDPEILGGMIVTVGSQMIDDSVRRKLERLHGAMVSGGANQNVALKQVG